MLRWEQGRETIEKMISDGHLQVVPANRDYADELIAQARAYLESAHTIVAANPDAAYVLAYDACRKALTAILENQGLRPTTRGGHIAVIDAAIAQLEPPLGNSFRPVDRMRARRNRIEYPNPGVGPVTDEEVAETLPKAAMVIDASAKVLDAMPAWS